MRRARAFVHLLTAIHATGALVVLGMAVFVAADAGNADRLATTPGGRQLVRWTGAWLAAFFGLLATFLAALAYGSHRGRPWSWPAALGAYSVGVLGSLIEIFAGHANYVASLAVNGAVVVLLLRPEVRGAFRPARDEAAPGP